MDSILELQPRHVDQPQVRLVDERRGLERVIRALVVQVVLRQLAERRVEHLEQGVRRGRVSRRGPPQAAKHIGLHHGPGPVRRMTALESKLLSLGTPDGALG
jgi:hypothetical protein